MGNYENCSNCSNQYESACERYESQCDSRYGRSRNACCGLCSMKVIGFFVVALAAALGLIFGAVYAEQIFAALAAVIVFAAVMLVAIIAILLYRWCECR